MAYIYIATGTCLTIAKVYCADTDGPMQTMMCTVHRYGCLP